MSINRIAELNALDAEHLLKNSQIGEASRPTYIKTIVKKPLTFQEEDAINMIKNQKGKLIDFSSRIKGYEYQTPEGETKYHKYLLPEELPDFQPINEKEDDESQRHGKVLQFDTEMKRIEENMRKILEEGKLIKSRKEKLKKRVDQMPELDSTKKGIYNIEINMADKKMAELNNQYQNLNNLLHVIPEKKQEYINNQTELKAINENIKKQNRLKLERFQKETTELNSGAFDTTKYPQESEQEYLKRMSETAQLQDVDSVLQNAKTAIYKDLRASFREIIRDEVIIEQVLNGLEDYNDITFKEPLLKYFDKFKMRFIEKYGLTPRTKLNAYEIIQFIKDMLSFNYDKNKLNLDVEPDVKSKQIRISPITEDDVLVIDNVRTNKKLYLRWTYDSVQREDPYALLYSFTNEKGSFKEYFDAKIPNTRTIEKSHGKMLKSSDDIERNTGLTKKELNEVFGIYREALNPSEIAKKLKTIYNIHITDLTKTERKPYKYRGGEQEHIQIGYGIAGMDIPQYAKFGEINILLRMLYYKNQLSVRDRNMKTIAGFTSVKVSEPFVKIIMSMMEGLYPTHSDISHLPTAERILYDKLVHLAGFQKKYPHQADKTIPDLKKRLKLLEAEIEIGNNSPLIKKEIHKILYTLHDLGAVALTQIKEYLKQI